MPPASCSDAIRQAAENLTAPCEDLKDAPLDERLSVLAAFHRAFGDPHQCAQREPSPPPASKDGPCGASPRR